MNMNVKTKRELIKKVMKYKSGEDSIGSVYVGSMAASAVCSLLGMSYGIDCNIAKGIDKAEEPVVSQVYDYLATYIEYMVEHPREKCPHCGQIIKKEKV